MRHALFVFFRNRNSLRRPGHEKNGRPTGYFSFSSVSAAAGYRRKRISANSLSGIASVVSEDQGKTSSWFPASRLGMPTEKSALPADSVRTEEILRLETLLFLSREPLGAKKLAQFLELREPKTVNALIARLNRFYDETHSTFRVLDFAGGFQLRTRPQFTPWLRRLCHYDGNEGQESPEIRLSPPAAETLAIIAYRQPIVRAEIESVRGVQCGEILRQLLGRDLIRIAGRSSELGRPFLYETTRKFLEIYGLKSLSQLPKIEYTGKKDV